MNERFLFQMHTVRQLTQLLICLKRCGVVPENKLEKFFITTSMQFANTVENFLKNKGKTMATESPMDL